LENGHLGDQEGDGSVTLSWILGKQVVSEKGMEVAKNRVKCWALVLAL